MLLAYIDEIGETGAFVARDDPQFNTSPAFGYAGFILPADKARLFGGCFTEDKRRVFKSEIADVEHPGRWERKGSSIFRPDTLEQYPQQTRVFNGLVNQVRRLGGSLFYYADEKPVGTPKQTRLDTTVRETVAMREALNRIARHADSQGKNVMVVIDQINEKTQAARLPAMYGHILGRAADFPEMRRIIEPPMHVDSVLSANIQFADCGSTGAVRAPTRQCVGLPPRVGRQATTGGSSGSTTPWSSPTRAAPPDPYASGGSSRISATMLPSSCKSSSTGWAVFTAMS